MPCTLGWGPTIATHLALLLLAASGSRLCSAHARLAARFTAAEIPFLTEAEAEAFTRWTSWTRKTFLTALAEYDRRPFLIPVDGAELDWGLVLDRRALLLGLAVVMAWLAARAYRVNQRSL